MTCKSICTRYQFKRKWRDPKVYSHGGKRCQICEINIMWNGIYCPCCGYKLRTRPRNRTSTFYQMQRQQAAKLKMKFKSGKKNDI